MSKPAGDKDYVQSLDRGLAVILAFADHPRLSLAELAERTELSRPTVRRILMTLEKLGYIRSDGKFHALTPHVLALGNAYLSSLSITEAAQPYLEELAKVTGHTCSLAALDGEDAVFLTRVPSRRVMRHTLTTGTRLPAFATSMGRVLLAGLPGHEIEEFLQHAPFPRYTTHTVTEADELREVLRQVREQGWALINQEFEEGVRSFSAPVLDLSQRTVASLSMSVPTSTVSLAEIYDHILPVVVESAAEISKQLGGAAASGGRLSIG